MILSVWENVTVLCDQCEITVSIAYPKGNNKRYTW